MGTRRLESVDHVVRGIFSVNGEHVPAAGVSLRRDLNSVFGLGVGDNRVDLDRADPNIYAAGENRLRDSADNAPAAR